MATLPDPRGQVRDSPQPSTSVARYQATNDGEESIARANMAAAGARLTDAGRDGNQLIALGIDVYNEQMRLDTLKAEDAINRLRASQQDLTIGNDGYARKQGSDAVQPTFFPQYMGKLETAAKDISGGLDNDNQREIFKRRAPVVSEQFKGGLLNHSFQQYGQLVDKTTADTIAVEGDNIAADPFNEMTAATSMARVSAALEAQRKHKGWPATDPTAMAEASKAQDAILVKRVDAMAAMDPIKADAFLKANKANFRNIEIYRPLEARVAEQAVNMQANGTAATFVNDAIQGLVRQQSKAPAIEDGPAGSITDTGMPSNAPKSVRQNNPGNIVDVSTGQIRTYATPAEGAAALETDLKLKLSGNSPAYKRRFGTQPVTPERLAETWAPAAAKGNSQESTTNYGKAIASALGIQPGDVIANTPENLAKVKAAITQFEAGSYSSGNMVTVGAPGQQPQFQTTITPTSKDLAAQLPALLNKVQDEATRLYGSNVNDPRRYAFVARTEAAIKSQLGSKVDQLTRIQKEDTDAISDYVQGLSAQPVGDGMVATGGGGRAGGAGMMRVTSIPQLQAMNPQLFAKFQRLPADAKTHIVALMEAAARADDRGDSQTYLDMRDRINLPEGDPKKINWPQQITQDPRFRGLTMGQWSALRSDLANAATDSGRTQNAVMQGGTRLVQSMFKSDQSLTMGGINPARADYATQLWQFAVDKKVAEYKAAGKDVRTLFDPDPKNKDSMVTPLAIAPFAQQAGGAGSPGAGMAEGAQAVRDGKVPPIAAPAIEQPATITTREQLNTWLQSLPPEVTTFKTPDGKVYAVPPRAAAAPAPGTPAAQPTMDVNGKIVPPPAPKPVAPAVKTDASQFAVVDRAAEFAYKARQAREIRELTADPSWLESVGYGVRNMVNPLAPLGQAIQSVFPAGSEHSFAAFQAIKRMGTLAPSDRYELEEVLKYGQLNAADEKLAKDLLAKLGKRK